MKSLLAVTVVICVLLFAAGAGAQSSCAVATNQPPNAATLQKSWPTAPAYWDLAAASPDPDGDPVRLIAVSDPGPGGRAIVQADQKQVRFEPAATANWAQFTYTVTDDQSGTAQGVVQVGDGLPPRSVTVRTKCVGLKCTFSAEIYPPHEAVNAQFDWRIVRPPAVTGESPVTEVDLRGYTPTVMTTSLAQWDRRYEVYLTARTTSGGTPLTFSDTNMRTPTVPPVTADIGFDNSFGRMLRVWVASTSLNWGGGTFTFNFGDSATEVALTSMGRLANNDAPPVPCPVGNYSSCFYVDHPYTTLGVYPVQLTVTPYNGAPVRFTQLIEVKNQLPSPQIVATEVSGSVRTWRFQPGADTRDDRPLDKLTHQWSFGDGTYAQQGQQSYVEHQFSSGKYTVTLTSTDEDGASGTATRAVEVLNTPPVSSFWIECTNGRQCVFRSESTDADGPIQEYQWTAAGQSWTTGNDQTPFTFPNDGKQVVTLTTVDSSGATSQASRVVWVNGGAPRTPLAFFAVQPCRAFSSIARGAPVPSNTVVSADLGNCGVPVDAVAAELNVSAVSSTGAGHVLVWAKDTPAPGNPTLNFPAADARVNNATIEVSRAAISLMPFVSAGSPATTHLLVDVSGYWAPEDTPPYAASSPALYLANSSCMLLADSVRNNGISRIESTYPYCQWPDTVAALWATLRVKDPSAGGHMTLYRLDDPLPPVATMNFPAGRSISNSTVVRTSITGDGAMLAYATVAAATATVGIDVWANFAPRASAQPAALAYVPTPPCRVLDTRSADYGMPRSATDPRSVTLVGNCGIPRDASMVRMNVTVLNAAADAELHINRRLSGFLKAGDVFSAGIIRRIYGSTDTVARPYDDVYLSAIHPTTRAIVAADFIADVVGYFAPLPEDAQ